MAKRLLWVICMLAVMTAQLYNAAFAMPMQHTTMSAQTSDTVMNHAQYDEPDEMMNCCQPLANNSDSGCNSADLSCDSQSHCAQSHCLSSIGVAANQYLFSLDTATTTVVAATQLMLPQNRGSLYRPPISH